MHLHHTDSEVDITNDLIGYKQLITSYLVSSDIELCLYKEPFIKNALNILEPENPIKIKEVDVFLVRSSFTASGKRLGREVGIMINY